MRVSDLKVGDLVERKGMRPTLGVGVVLSLESPHSDTRVLVAWRRAEVQFIHPKHLKVISSVK